MIRPGTKVLFTSGYSEETMGSRGIVAQGLDYLPKPFDAAKLTTKVSEALASSANQRAGSMGGGT